MTDGRRGAAAPGLPPEAFTYFEGLAADNSTEYFAHHRECYERTVLGPMTELTAVLAAEFGEPAMLRPQRDTRMSHDKSPYKLYQGAYVDIRHAIGFWVHLDASGLYASGRFYPRTAGKVNRYRAAVEDEARGPRLAALLAELEAQGLTVGGTRLKTRPRGITVDHPRLGLLRHRTLDKRGLVNDVIDPRETRASNYAIDLYPGGDEDRARVRAHLMAVHVRQREEPAAHFDIGGHYEAEMVRTPAGWRIRRFTFDLVWNAGQGPNAGH